MANVPISIIHFKELLKDPDQNGSTLSNRDFHSASMLSFLLYILPQRFFPLGSSRPASLRIIIIIYIYKKKRVMVLANLFLLLVLYPLRFQETTPFFPFLSCSSPSQIRKKVPRLRAALEGRDWLTSYASCRRGREVQNADHGSSAGRRKSQK